MVPAISQRLSFDEFMEWYPNSGHRYELHEGVIVETPKPTGKHSEIDSPIILVNSPVFVVGQL